MKVHRQITENIVEFSRKQNDSASNNNIALENEENQDESRKRNGHDLHEKTSKKVRLNGTSKFIITQTLVY